MPRYFVLLYQKTKSDVLRYFFRSGHWPFGGGLEPALVGWSLPFAHDGNYTPQEEDKKSEGFLWGVPKKRTSLEKRWCKNMGAENWLWKMLIPKYNIRICETCGHHYEAKHLCRNCYERVKAETEVIRKKIEADIGRNPEDKGVVILYENEKNVMEATELKQSDRMIVEIPKERPAWFSSNLLQKTTAEPDPETTTVATTKPNLG